MRRQSLERPEARLTLTAKAAPPLRHICFRKLRGVVLRLLEAPRRNVHRQRLKTRTSDVNGDEVCRQFAIQKEGPHVAPHTSDHPPLVAKLLRVCHRTTQKMMIDTIEIRGPTTLRKGSRTADSATQRKLDNACTGVAATQVTR